MKYLFFSIVIVFGLVACLNSTNRKSIEKLSIDTLHSGSRDKLERNHDSNTRSRYDKIFLDKLSEYREPVKLSGNILLTGQDTVYFPEDLLLHQETIFKGSKDNSDFLLILTRTNLTGLNYSFQLMNSSKHTEISKSGRAILNPFFFLGAESDDDDRTGEGYLSVEYTDESSNCLFAIRIGERDENGKLRAKIKLFCKDSKTKSMDLDEIPTLREE